MTEKENILTPEGYRNLEKKLEYYKTHHRREVAERIRQAKEFGEIGENSEYEDAKSEQAFIEGEIMNLENILRHARIIDKKEIQTDRASIGSTILLKDLNRGEEVEYQIVGTTESDPSAGKISNESPVGASLCGAKKGQTLEIKTPGGLSKYKIIKIYKTEF